MKKAPFSAKNNYSPSSTIIQENTSMRENQKPDRRATTLTSLKAHNLSINKKNSTSASK